MAASRNKPNGRCHLCEHEVTHIVAAFTEAGRLARVVRVCGTHAEPFTTNPALRVTALVAEGERNDAMLTTEQARDFGKAMR